MVRDYKKELEKYIQEIKKEKQITSEAEETINQVWNAYLLNERFQSLKKAKMILINENISITEEFETVYSMLEKQKEDSIYNMIESFSKTMKNINQIKFITFISLIEKKQNQEIFEILIKHITDEQKEKIYSLLHEEKVQKENDKKLIQSFENKLGYSFNAMKKNISVNIPKEFETFFSTYITNFNQRTISSINWLREDVLTMNLNEKMVKKYTIALIRRLDIGQEIENEEEKRKYINKATNEFLQLLNESMKKKKS